MYDVEGALRHLLDAAVVTPHVETLSITEAAGRVVAQSCYASVDVPPFDNSAMDGYAVNAHDIQPGKQLAVSQKLFAGDAVKSLEPHTAARVFTGSMIPPGADTVVIQEEAHEINGQVVFDEPVRVGQHIRKAGEDIKSGSIVVEAGSRLTPAMIGLLVSTGISTVNVYKPLRIGLLSTGSELIEPGELLEPGQIFNSNRYMLSAQLAALGFDVLSLTVADTLDEIVSSMKTLASSSDVIVTIGGVSVGEADLVREAIETLGDVSMWKVAMKPGKPLSFGHVSGTALLGLPGNPVSAFTTFQLFAKPFLLAMQGEHAKAIPPYYYPVLLDKPVCPRREEFLRVSLQEEQGQLVLKPYPKQGSGVLSSVVQSSGFARIPMNRQTNPGDKVLYMPFNDGW